MVFGELIPVSENPLDADFLTRFLGRVGFSGVAKSGASLRYLRGETSEQHA